MLQKYQSISYQSTYTNPVDFSRNDPIWVITDGSKIGVGVVYGQGISWEQYHPAGFLSKKFLKAQHNYHTHEYETIAVVEALIKGEGKILGQKFPLVQTIKALSTSRPNWYYPHDK